MSFSNKQALIVGGSSGMGLEAGRLLVESGASVTLIGRRQQKLDAARETFDTPDSTSTFRCDLTRKEDVDRLIRYIGDEMKDVKCLVNAAGVFSPKAFLEHTSEDYDAYMDLNKATFFVTQQVAKNMAANGGGAVVNLGSMWAHQAIKATPSSAYSMAKCRPALLDSASGDGTGGIWHTCQRSGSRRGGDSNLRRLHQTRRGSRGPTSLQRFSSNWPDRKT